MMHRFSLFPATLTAGLVALVAPALIPAPAHAQSKSSNFADTTTQAPSPYQGQVVENVVARVNDQVISTSDYERAEQELEQEAHQQNWTQQQVMEQKRDLLRSLIDQQLLLAKGKELGINGETELVKRLDDIRKQNHLDTMEDLQKAAESQGVSFEDFKQQIRDRIITQDVISQEVGSKIQISPSEVQQYYNTHKQEFDHPEQVRMSEILIPTPDPDNAAQVADAQKKADAIETRLKAGADFATVAKADSAGTTAAQGGDLGSYKPGQLAKVLEDATFSLQPGQITQPIRTKQGWLILKVTQHEKAGLAPLPEVQNQIQEELGYAKMEPALRDYLEDLRNKYFIEVKAPYSDSGATPNEVKLIQSAYTPPQPKKKKKVQRARFRQVPARRGKTVDTAVAAAPPAGVPTLDQVNSQKGSTTQVASASTGTQKPGKKEKIRFGQAPRETLPGGETKSVDAGAAPTQVAENNPPASPADNAAADNDKKSKTRFADRDKQAQAKAAAEKKLKHQKFTPPTETPEQLAVEKQQDAALGLNGDTTKPKKAANPAKTGPKRRMSDDDKKDEDKKKDELTTPTQTTTPTPAPAQTNNATPGMGGPMQTQTPNAGSASPATSAGSQSAPATQGTGPSAPQ